MIKSLIKQIQALQTEGCEVIYKEKFTDTKTDRTEFNKVIEALQERDTLVVTKLDKFARSAVEGIQTAKALFVKGVKVHILNMGLVGNIPKRLAKQRDDFKEKAFKAISTTRIRIA
ncbi:MULTISPECIES: recombinase family protein [Bacillus]|uniref:recombinase family protein n=1 Tax=Bacillus TaxID=1386 RepID=UPI00387E7633